MKPVKQYIGNSSLLYIAVLSLCIANPLAAVSLADTISGYARQAWNAMPSREQVIQQVNPLNMTPEQRQRLLLYAGVAGALGVGGAATYKYLYNNASTSEAQNEQRAIQIIQSFYDKRKSFDSLSPADKIDIIKQIWAIEEELIQLLNQNRTSESFAENTLTTSLKIITKFLAPHISTLNIEDYSTMKLLDLNPLATANIKDEQFAQSLKEISEILQKKKNAIKYYNTMQTKLSNSSVNLNFKKLRSNIQNINLVLPKDSAILMSLYNTVESEILNRSPSDRSSHESDTQTKQKAPSQDTDQPLSSSASAPIIMETPVQTPTPSSVPTTQPSVATQQTSTSPREHIAPIAAQPTSLQTPTTSQTINNLKKIDISQKNAASTIINELSNFAYQTEEQKQQLEQVYNQKRRALELLDELKNIHDPNKLQKFSENLKDEDLSNEDKETLKKEITQKRKSLIQSVIQAASGFKTPEPNPSASSSATSETVLEKPTHEKAPSLVGGTTPANPLEQRTAHMTVRVTLIPGIEKAKTLQDLIRIKEMFDNDYRSAVDQKDIDAFQTAYDTKYPELMQQQFESAKTLQDLEKIYTDYKPDKDNKNIKLFNTAYKQRTQQIKFRMKLTKQIHDTQNLNDLQQLKETFNDHKNELNQTDIKILQQAYKKHRELIAQQTEQPSQASAPSKITPTPTPTSNEQKTTVSSFPNNPAQQPENPLRPKEWEKEKADEHDVFTKLIDIPQETIEPLLTLKGQVTPPIANIAITNNTNETIRLAGSYVTRTSPNAQLETINIETDLAPQKAEQLGGDVQSINIKYYNTGGWFPITHSITENQLAKDNQIINIYTSALTNSYTYNIVSRSLNYINPNLHGKSPDELQRLVQQEPYKILNINKDASYPFVIEALQNGIQKSDPEAHPYLYKAAYYMQAGSSEQRKQLKDLGKDISDILRTKIDPIPNDEINNPDIWNNPSLQGKLQEIKRQFGPDDTFAKHLMAKAFIIYLYSIAHALGHIFDEGTFVIHDNPQDLYNPAKRANASVILAFLANMPGVNRRGASHFNQLAVLEPNKYAHLTGSVQAQTFYGLNLDLTKETQGDEQPKTTILFNRVASTEPSWHYGNQNSPQGSKATFYQQTPISIFIKPERFGTKDYAELAFHAWDLAKIKFWKFMGSEMDDQAKYSKERVPVYLQKAFDNLIATTVARADAKNKPLALDLKKYNTVDGWGIQKYLELTDTQNPPSKGEDTIVRFAPQEAEKFRQLILANQTATLDNGEPDLLKRAKYTHLKDRFGHEVSLDGNDLTTGESSQSGSSSIQH